MIAGLTAMSVGLPELNSYLISVLVFAGAAQLAALQLMEQMSPLPVIIFTALIINLRFVMYSASLAPHIKQHGFLKKLVMSYLLTDQAYAVSIMHYEKEPEPHPAAYYTGAALVMWVTWQIGTLAGILLGAQVPSAWSLDFAIPIVFMVLLLPSISDRPQAAAALCSGVVALAASGAPYNLGLVGASICGILTGYFCEKRAACRIR